MKSVQEKYEKCRELIGVLIRERLELATALEQERKSRTASCAESKRAFSELRELMQKSVDRLQLSIIEKNDRIDALTSLLSLYESQDIAKIRFMLKAELREELAAEIRAELSQELRDSLQGAKAFIDRIYDL